MTAPSARFPLLLALLLLPLAGARAQNGASGADARLADAAMKREMAIVRTLLEQKVDVNAPGKDGTPPLHWVVRVDDVDTARALLRAGADAKGVNRYGVTPLYLACANGNAAMIRLLLDAGADANVPDSTGETPLMTASKVGNLDAVALLIERGAVVDARDPEFQQTALMVAVRDNHPDVVRLLVEHHADVNAKTRTGRAPAWVLPNSVPGFGHGIGIIRGGLPMRGSRSLTPGGLTPLLYAARDGRLESARILLAAGANLQERDPNAITPLLIAIANDHPNVAQFAIERGADVNVVDWYGRTPLWTAIETRNMDVDSGNLQNGVDRDAMLALVKVLLNKGADPNTRMKEVPPIRRQMLGIGSLAWVDYTGQTPFITAALAGDVTVMQLLLDYGADPYVTTFGGTSALMAAAGMNWVVDQTYDEGAKALLEAVNLCYALGMDVNAVNEMGLTAVHAAANRGSDEIIEFLVQKGAKLDVKDKEGRSPLNWADGVFLATHPGKRKPGSIALIRKLTGAGDVATR
ncbi:MAG: ankyrin repeat domain-containing protein [Acidobacteriota bacterium]